MKSARLVSVILVEDGATRTYYTAQGILIGEFKEGARTKKPNLPMKVEKKKGGVVSAMSPKQAKQEKEKETDRTVADIYDKK